MPLHFQYIGNLNYEKDFTEEEKQFFHNHIGVLMLATDIGVLCQDSLEEFIWRINHLQLFIGGVSDHQRAYFEKFCDTRINENTKSRLVFLRRKNRDAIQKYNSQWAKSVESKRFKKSYYKSNRTKKNDKTRYCVYTLAK